MADAEPGTNTTSKRRSRAITNLTQQQRQRKRDLDRKAQRALRQRTKDRLEDLQTELENLRGQSNARLASVEAELQTFRQLNRDLRSRLRQISILAKGDEASLPIDENDGQNHEQDDVDLSRDQSTVDVEDSSPSSSASGSSYESAVHHDHAQSERLEGHPPDAGNSGQVHENPYSADDVGMTPNYADNQAITGTAPVGVSPGSHQPDVMTIDLPMNQGITTIPFLDHMATTDRTQGLVSPSLERVSHTSPESTITRASYYSGPAKVNTTVSSFLPQHLPSTCPLDQILLDFLSSRRALAANGTPSVTLLGPDEPYVAAIVEPQLATFAHPISRVMAEVLSTFPNVAIPEKIAFMYLMHRTMRWQVSPTREHYLRLATWLRPTVTQITVPHAAWIDNIPWPRVRDALIENPDRYPFETFSEIYSQNVTVNWPYDAMDAVTKTGIVTGEYVLNSIFEKHIQKLSNWSVSRQFEILLPDLTSAIYSRD